jgi:hypothetical protein
MKLPGRKQQAPEWQAATEALLMAAGTQFILLTESPAFEKSLVAFKGGIKNENFDCGA